jgi:hypothetical protein
MKISLGWWAPITSRPTAINELEMWQAATFDLARIDKELGWAESIGMTQEPIDAALETGSILLPC